MPLPVSHKISEQPIGFASATELSQADGRELVEIYHDANRVLPVWQELLTVAPASAYQTPGFLLPWLATRGAEAGIEPLFILKKDKDGTPMAVFCLGLKRFGPLRAAVFLGEKDSNFNFGLFRPGYVPDREALLELFRKSFQRMRSGRPDILLLLNQPFTWNDWFNPLSILPHQASPSCAYRSTLTGGAESFFAAQLSKDTRKKLRKKESRLAEIGALRLLDADSVARAKIIDAFFDQKIARFEARRIDAGFDGAAMRCFAETASNPPEPNMEGRLELHALACGERIVAVYGGATTQGHFSGFFNSFDADPEIAKSSPGDLLLMKLIAAKAAQGVKSFDLGIGEARYKTMVCDETVPLFDSIVPLTVKGRLAALVFALSLKVKRTLKQNQKAFALTRRVRSMLRPRR